MKKVLVLLVFCFFVSGLMFIGKGSDLYAAPSEKGQSKGKGHDKDKKDKKDKDDDRGPSVPAAPMAAAVLIGLGAVGAGMYYFRKKKKNPVE